MSHWLEEAEREEQRKKERPSRESAKIQDKIFRIKENYEANKKLYEDFKNYLFDLCERANNLPHEKKLPWVKIEFRNKESKLENQLYYAATSERIDKTVMTKVFPFVKRQHYKHIHTIHINVSKDMGMAEIEVRDDYLAKTKIATESGEPEQSLNDGLPRLKVVYEYDMKKLDKNLALIILDWLTFRTDVKSLPFSEDDFKYDHRKTGSKG